ncbi:probable WRKY transcription factor 46 [Zingiber officinale]|uniref:probable WRKY transcription factor 46 n=1 Tax=Zingiber officinale TaxID=94328 RepID=UPI001C4AA32C|nr:probable WRKY transcription factor 46 [Zingiber officinale]
MNIAFISQKDEQKRNGSQTHKNITTAPYDDGYLWRKYGEKKIRGNVFPRSYYRCTYREDKGCGATKQVQQECRSDPPLFLVTQKGEHTCNTAAPTTPGHGHMVVQTTSDNLVPALSMADHSGDCKFHQEFSYSSHNTTVESHPTNQFFYEDHSVLDNSALGTIPDAYAASMASDSNFSDEYYSFYENLCPYSQTFSVSDLKLEEFDFDEVCEIVLW